MVQSSLPKATGCSSVASPRAAPPTSTGSTPNGTGLEQLTQDADKHYWGSSFSPEFDDEGWGDIVAARYPPMGMRATQTCFLCTWRLVWGFREPHQERNLG